MSRPAFALLPLDDRPPNFQFPRRLAAIGGVDLRLPPRRLLGRFLRPGNVDGLLDWLADAVRGAAGVIISCDMLAYGGLVASRTTEVTRRAAAARLGRLRELKRRCGDARIYAFAVIPRLGLTVSSRRLAELGPKLARYQELRHRPCLDETEADELARLGEEVPRDLVARHAAMRRRNLSVNRALVAMVHQELLDFLVLAQEDAPRSGPHIAEQSQLISAAADLGVAHAVRIFPGADEQGMVLLARAALEACGASATVYPLYSTRGGAEATALFEDRPLRMTVAGQVNAAGLTLSHTAEAADLLLALHSPPGKAQTDVHHVSPTSAPRASFVNHVAQRAHAGAHVALADVAYCNGADPALIAAMRGHRIFPHLAAFAGWNTAGNTIGCALAQAVMRMIGQGTARRQRAQLQFLFERLLDDFGYQTVVRADAYRFARAELGDYPLNLARARRRAAGYVRERLAELARELFAGHFAGGEVHGWRIADLRELRIRLPWPRLFEVEVESRIALQ